MHIAVGDLISSSSYMQEYISICLYHIAIARNAGTGAWLPSVNSYIFGSIDSNYLFIKLMD